MSFFNSEKGQIEKFRAELEALSDEELEKIAKTEVKTSFFGFSSGNDKQRQVLRERVVIM